MSQYKQPPIIPWYLGSNRSSLRSFTLTSAGNSGAASVFSSPSFSAGAAFSAVMGFSIGASTVPFPNSLLWPGRGVVALVEALVEVSSSSTRTNSGSNSLGSGPFPIGSPIPSTGRFRGALVAGDAVLAGCLRGGNPGRPCPAWSERCRACSSAIRVSMAPFSRCSQLAFAE